MQCSKFYQFRSLANYLFRFLVNRGSLSNFKELLIELYIYFLKIAGLH